MSRRLDCIRTLPAGSVPKKGARWRRWGGAPRIISATAIVSAPIFVALVFGVLRNWWLWDLDFYFRWDASAHFLSGVMVADALAAHDWSALAAIIAEQTYWPFLRSLVLGAFMHLAGISPRAAIICTNLFALLSSGLLYCIARRTDSANGHLCGWFALANLLACPIFVTLSCVPMLEVYALFFLLCTVDFFQRALARESRLNFSLSGVSLLALLFTKYEYAFVLALGLSLFLIGDCIVAAIGTRSGGVGVDVGDGSPAPRREFNPSTRLIRRSVYLVVPVLSGLTCWLTLCGVRATLPAVRGALASRGVFGTPMDAWHHLPIFVDNVRGAYHAYDGLFYANVCLAAVALARWRRFDQNLALVTLLLLSFSFFLLLPRFTEPRLLLPYLPLFWLLSAKGLALLIEGRRSSRLRAYAGGIAVVAVLTAAIAPHDVLHSRRERVPFTLATAAFPRDVLAVLERLVAQGGAVTIVGGIENAFSPGLIEWEILRKPARRMTIQHEPSRSTITLAPVAVVEPPPQSYVITLGLAANDPLPLHGRAAARAIAQRIEERTDCFSRQSSARVERYDMRIYRVISSSCVP